MGSNAPLIWSLDYKDFPHSGSDFDKIKFLLRYAILAPSGHNTQPWLFSIKDETVEIYANLKKRLFVMDPSSRELYLSIGACLANLSLAAAAFKVKIEVVYFPNGLSDELCVRVNFKGLFEARLEDPVLLSAMVARRNNRENYLANPIEDEIKESWRSFVKEADFRLDLVTDPIAKQGLALATGEGLRMAFSNKSFRRELADWIRNNYVYCEDGIPVNTTDMPAPSLIAAALIKLIDIGPMKAKNDKKKMVDSPLVAVISSKENNPKSWLKSGEIFEKIQVSAAGSGIASAVLVAAVEEGELYKKVQEILGTDFRPQMIFRLGYPSKQSLHAPRVPVEKLIVSPDMFLSKV